MRHLRYIELVNAVTSELPPLPIAALGRPLLRPLHKPLRQLIALGCFTQQRR
jgi:hypothetical protein